MHHFRLFSLCHMSTSRDVKYRQGATYILVATIDDIK